MRNDVDAGFTIVEVLVALLIFAVAAAALIPLIAVSVKAAGTARLETQAKNLTQQQIERMRNLAFHVAHENGDFVDLLDLYFTDVNTGTATLTPTSSPRSSKAYQDADGTVRAQYLTDAGGMGGKPSGPAYRVYDLQLAGYPAFTLDVYTQFLRTTRTIATPPSTYNSQADAVDSPPAQLVGLTILTTWRDASGSQTYRTYTELADGRGTDGLLTTQSRATALRVTGADTTGNNLLAQAGVVQSDGSVTSASNASAVAEAARLEQVAFTSATGRRIVVAAPPSPVGSSGASTTTGPTQLATATGSPTCGWASVGTTQVADVTASTGLQQPLVPSDGGTDATTGTKRVQAGVLVNGSGCGGYSFRMRPDADGVWLPPVTYGVDSSKPVVGVPDTGGTPDLANAAVRAGGQVAATSVVTPPIFSSAFASASTKQVNILPVNGFSSGLVQATLTSSSLTCASNASASATYSLLVTYPGGSRTISWSSASGGATALPDPASVTFTVGGVTRTLAEYLTWSTASAVTEGTNGVSTFGPALRVTVNKDVLGTMADLAVELGVLSCVATDRR